MTLRGNLTLPLAPSRQGRGDLWAITLLLCCAFCSVLLLVAPAHADTFSGYIEGKGFAYPNRASSRDPWVAGWGTLFNKWESKLGETQLTASFRAEWISTDEQSKRLFDPADRHIRRPPFSLQDLWLRVPIANDIDLQAGRFQLGWGKTDGYSPADAFLPRDLSDPFSDEKLPLWGVRLTGEKAGLRFDAVVTPITTPWRLPVLGSRNAPMTAAGIPVGTIFVEQDEPPTEFGFAALRVMKTSGDWDLGAWARVGTRPAPLLDFRIAQASLGLTGFIIPVGRHFAKEEGIGVEASRVIGAWVVRGELAGLLSRDSELGDAVIAALSAEKGFGDGTLLMTLAANLIQPPVSESLLFDRGILPAFIVAWNQTEEWGSWKVVWTCGLKKWDGLIKGEIGYNITDLWKISLGADIPYGPESGSIGALVPATRGYLALRRSW